MWRRYSVSTRHPNPRSMNDMPQRRVAFWLQRKFSMTPYRLNWLYGASILAWRKYNNTPQQVWVSIRFAGKLHFFKVPRKALYLAKPFNRYIPGEYARQEAHHAGR